MERVAIQLAPVASSETLQSSDNLGTLNWKTEHDSKYTPIVFTQDFRYFERDMNADILLSLITRIHYKISCSAALIIFDHSIIAVRVSGLLLLTGQQYISDVPLARPVPTLLDLVLPIGRQNMMLNIHQLSICKMRGNLVVMMITSISSERY